MLAYDHYGSRYESKYSITVHSTGPWEIQQFCAYKLGKLESAYMGNTVWVHIHTAFISDAKKLGSRICQSFPSAQEATDSEKNQLYRKIRGVIGGWFMIGSTLMIDYMLYFKFSAHKCLWHSALGSSWFIHTYSLSWDIYQNPRKMFLFVLLSFLPVRVLCTKV